MPESHHKEERKMEREFTEMMQRCPESHGTIQTGTKDSVDIIGSAVSVVKNSVE